MDGVKASESAFRIRAITCQSRTPWRSSTRLGETVSHLARPSAAVARCLRRLSESSRSRCWIRGLRQHERSSWRDVAGNRCAFERHIGHRTEGQSLGVAEATVEIAPFLSVLITITTIALAVLGSVGLAASLRHPLPIVTSNAAATQLLCDLPLLSSLLNPSRAPEGSG
ncbi:hypothetical protein BDV96DRAFT_638595 [Lophiotrema nucula]|uniref:Uncharacterized protein n=1 Tax=Lophiotrema nucula TaxID=690887 RepID=A0A6A5YET3_9PLEO|nr:hypothetical protein BDV96DRAFT_638595 [Lophiotrema nucula]